MKTKVTIVALVCLLLAGGLGAYYATGTPLYSLYILKKAMKTGDRETFYHHFDVTRVVKNAIARKTGKGIPGLGDLSDRMAERVLPAVEQAVRAKIEERMKDPEKDSFGKMTYESLRTDGDRSVVTLRKPEDGSTTELTLERMPDRHWKVVDVDLGNEVELPIELPAAEAPAPGAPAPGAPAEPAPQTPPSLPGPPGSMGQGTDMPARPPILPPRRRPR